MTVIRGWWRYLILLYTTSVCDSDRDDILKHRLRAINPLTFPSTECYPYACHRKKPREAESLRGLSLIVTLQWTTKATAVNIRSKRPETCHGSTFSVPSGCLCRLILPGSKETQLRNTGRGVPLVRKRSTLGLRAKMLWRIMPEARHTRTPWRAVSAIQRQGKHREQWVQENYWSAHTVTLYQLWRLSVTKCQSVEPVN